MSSEKLIRVRGKVVTETELARINQATMRRNRRQDLTRVTGAVFVLEAEWGEETGELLAGGVGGRDRFHSAPREPWPGYSEGR